jgi:hypothetical protein
MIHNAWEFKELFICPPTISLIKKFVTAEGSMILSTRELKVLCIWPPTNNFRLIKNLWRQKAPQFRIYTSLKCYTWPSINNFIVIKNMWHRKARQLPPTSLGWVQEFLPRLHIQLASIVQARSSHAIIYDVHIFIIIRLVLMRLDGSLVKYSWGRVITPPTRLSLWWDRTYCQVDEAKATQSFE